ncbi:hypothetical protein [Planctomicrobium sp. SH664]|uniref:hypothetical protein n=1 Tax=Planctomicrobium sp. SH664 TaxID=3448125 RepID=UPI003F5BD0CE
MKRTAGIAWLMSVVLGGMMLIPSPALEAGSSNSLMDLSTDGTLLACSNRDSGTVTIVDLQSRRKLSEVAVGTHPEGVTFLGSSHRLAVAVYGEDCILMLDADSGQVTGRIEVFAEPYSVVSSPDGSTLWATLEYPGRIVEIDVATAKIRREQQVGEFLRGLAICGDRLLVCEYLTGIVKAIDPQTLTVTDSWIGSKEDGMARQLTVHPHRPKAYLPHQRTLTHVAHGSGSIFPYVSVLDTEAGEGKRRKRVQMDSFRGVYVVANPWEVALSPDGKSACVAFSGTNDLFLCEVLDDDYQELRYLTTFRTGANPRAVRFSPDGKRLFAYNALDFTVTEIDLATQQKVADIAVTTWPGSAEELLGKKLFYTAESPMSALRWISCSSCHPDGDADGRTWQQPEGLRNTQALFGLKETHPIHWSADRDEVQDFEHTIRSELMRGKGLIRGPVADSLGEKNAGKSRELDALAAYTNSHPFRLSPHGKGGLSEAGKRGREIFFSEKTGCATCHSGSYYTDRKLHDVGTGQSDPTELMGPLYDTPTLFGIYRTAPYLHHGQARTLEEVLTTCNPEDRHGVTSHLTPEQRGDLVEFLMQLPYELP